MGTVNNVFSNSLSSATTGAKNRGRVETETVKLVFDPKTLGAARQKNGQYPPTVKVDESVIETALLKHFGFDPNDAADVVRVKQLLNTDGSPFAYLKTTSDSGDSSDLFAYYNNRTGKYEVIDAVEKNLYRQLQGKAAEVKTQIERENKQNSISKAASPNDLIAGKNGILNNKQAELENKLNNQPSMSALNQNESEKTVKSLTGAIESVTGTGDPFAGSEIGKQFNRLGVSSLRLTGKAMELSNYFGEKINDAVRYVAPDSVDDLLNQADKTNRENAQALQNASSAVTNEDTFIDAKAKQLGQKIPITEDLANKLMYFPEAIPNAIDSAIRGDFKDDDGSYSDRVGKIIGGLNPAGDARDVIANIKGVVQGKNGAWIGLGAAAVGIIPIIGDGGKIVLKAEKKVIAETIEKLVKQGVEKEVAEKIAKEEVEKLVKQAVEKQYDEIAKSGHAVQRHGEDITERQLDERAMFGKDPVTATTDDAYNKFPDGTPRKHGYSKDATKFTSKDSLVKSEIYLKNTQQYKDKLKLAENGGQVKFEVENVKLEDVFGAEYKKEVFGKTRIGSKNNPIGTAETDFTDGTVTAVYQKATDGEWQLFTIFPKPKN